MTNNRELNTYLTNFFHNEVESFLSALPESRAIRINNLKTNKTEMVERLNQLKVDYTELSFNPFGFILNDDHIPLSHSLEFFQGYFQYQGISSQIPALVLHPKPGEKVLVMFSGCAPYPVVIGRNTKAKEIYGIELNPLAHKFAEENVMIG